MHLVLLPITELTCTILHPIDTLSPSPIIESIPIDFAETLKDMTESLNSFRLTINGYEFQEPPTWHFPADQSVWVHLFLQNFKAAREANIEKPHVDVDGWNAVDAGRVFRDLLKTVIGKIC